ncbi:GntR family transcriptional regulator [Colwellia sp. 1_MG-2023]|uniref:GntR family transcriptional regulator n=1 Tax=Colwellia sp. 1_MG-2023 TaxID=3062649 RepID=UPI0026E1955D|nr:GntR family transcriptional regulator [Colwellia sp. 1_MG-2023]MDO6447478.1 GntR family transcriptional regulator [Colwellia sp. 1_MG-2023]
MDIEINIEDSLPIFAQLVEQIKSAVQSEKIKPGDALPSIRQLANDLDINSKTVAKAYQLLERDSVIKSKGYRGTFIHEEAIHHTNFDINHWITTKLAETVSLLRTSGATDSEIRKAFTNVMNNKH